MITDLLLHPTIVSQAIADRPVAALTRALDEARRSGVRLWLYVGAIEAIQAASGLGMGQLSSEAEVFLRARLAAFAEGCQWLAALASDAQAALGKLDPLEAQLAVAAERLGEQGRLLTLEPDRHPHGRCLTPEGFLSTSHDLPIPFIDLAAQQDHIRGQIESRIHRVLHHGHFIMGPEVAELEQQLSTYVGSPHCITVASGTDSLEIALRALGIGVGDEVVTVPFTWISTAEVISAVGAKPVFVDIEATSYNLDPDKLSAAITPRTKAIMPVSLFGQMADLERIAAIAVKHGIPVIEDGAQSFGAARHGRRSCGVTLVGSTSFFPAKPLGCYGDGGALFCSDDALAAKMRAIRSHGGEKRHYHPYVGMNGRLDTLQASILLAKLDRWDWEVAERGRIGKRYSELINGVCLTPQITPGNTHVYAQYTIRVPHRERIAELLKAAGIPTAVYYPKCLHEQPVFKDLNYAWGSFPVSERASREVLSLPMHPYLPAASQDRIVATLRSSINKVSSP